MSHPASGASKQKQGSKVSNTSMDTVSTRIDLAHVAQTYGRNRDAMKQVKFHSILKKLMDERKISSRALAKKVGIPHSTISSYLSGKKASYSAEHIGLLATFFNVSSDYLLFGKENPLAVLNELNVEELFSGWLKVRVERAIPNKKDEDD